VPQQHLRQLHVGFTVLYLEDPTNPTLKVIDIAWLLADGLEPIPPLDERRESGMVLRL
jgi:hypothetical protein